MKWYHGTSKGKMEAILSSWYIPEDGMWGVGVYFSSSREGASCFGDYLLHIVIPEEVITYISFHEWSHSHPDEETWPDHIQKISQLAVGIRYPSGETELCVLNPDIIEMIYY